MMSRPHGIRRSLSPGNRSPSPAKRITKMKSTNVLADTVTPPNNPPSSNFEDLSESSFNTLRDPRMASTSDVSEGSTSPHHPDLSNEVAALSIKLIRAINSQTALDDTLAATRQELENAQNRLQVVELENEKFRNDMAVGILTKRSDVDDELSSLKAKLVDERVHRARIEKDKKNIEQELENLTAALFEEANEMVAAAKHEREAVEKKNEQLRAQLKDTESLLASHQEQLTQLKTVIQDMKAPRDEGDSNTSTAPSTPAAATRTSSRFCDSTNGSPISPGSSDVSPAPSTSFPQLIKAVCRTDVQAYNDFCELLAHANRSKPPGRASSGSYVGLSLGSLTGYSSAASSPARSSQNQSLGSPQNGNPHSALGGTRFCKRALIEDIEPTLRVDTAPGISWLMRRTVLSSICEGGLVVEPIPSASRRHVVSCALCGECRKSTENERTHRFRTSDNATAQRHALCVLCLEKVRACCEYTGYLRLILDGHIRILDAEEEKEAWNETVRLRERIFWSRIGGGVVPAFIPIDSSEKPSPEAAQARQQTNLEDLQKQDPQMSIPSQAEVQMEPTEHSAPEDPFLSTSKITSIGGTVISQGENSSGHASNAIQADTHDAKRDPVELHSRQNLTPEAEFGTDSRDSLREPTVSNDRLWSLAGPLRSNAETKLTLDISIPGSFE
ncbi:hypothetical protein V8E54_009965 [Elaphomyces granulatus]